MKFRVYSNKVTGDCHNIWEEEISPYFETLEEAQRWLEKLDKKNQAICEKYGVTRPKYLKPIITITGSILQLGFMYPDEICPLDNEELTFEKLLTKQVEIAIKPR